MTTTKYDLHTIEYSVQGWDAIMNTDMEKIDAYIPTRILGVLGESINAYQALYQNPTDRKWYKALADGTKQPCLGLAVEGGNANQTIRIHRLGEIANANWSWTGGAVFLSDTVEGGLTETKPSSNAQLIGYSLSSTKLLVGIESGFSDSIGGQNIISRGGTILNPTEAINIIVWRAPFSCYVHRIWGYRVGGTGATINARKNGSQNHLASALSLTSENNWVDGGVVQNIDYAAGDKLEIMVVSVNGTPSQIAIQVDFSLQISGS